MYLTGLADVVRAAGREGAEDPEWVAAMGGEMAGVS